MSCTHSLCTLPRWPRSFCPFHCHRVTVTRSSDSRLSDTEHGGRNHVSDRRGPWECETRVHSFLTRVVPPLVGRNEWLKGVNDVRRVGLRWLPAVTHLVACHAASHFVRQPWNWGWSDLGWATLVKTVDHYILYPSSKLIHLSLTSYISYSFILLFVVFSSTFWSHVGYFLTDGTVNFLLLIWWMNM